MDRAAPFVLDHDQLQNIKRHERSSAWCNGFIAGALTVLFMAWLLWGLT